MKTLRLLLATLILLAPLPAAPAPDPELQEAERQAKPAAEEKKREEAERDAEKARGERLKAVNQPLVVNEDVIISNPHTVHAHISVEPDKASYDSTSAWAI